eukprot:1870821-Amphidinium_carterae.1
MLSTVRPNTNMFRQFEELFLLWGLVCCYSTSLVNLDQFGKEAMQFVATTAEEYPLKHSLAAIESEMPSHLFVLQILGQNGFSSCCPPLQSKPK